MVDPHTLVGGQSRAFRVDPDTVELLVLAVIGRVSSQRGHSFYDRWSRWLPRPAGPYATRPRGVGPGLAGYATPHGYRAP
ncbi:hypothetical protein GCM10027436_01140 [Actinophytocola sediminis]